MTARFGHLRIAYRTITLGTGPSEALLKLSISLGKFGPPFTMMAYQIRTYCRADAGAEQCVCLRLSLPLVSFA